MKWMPDIDWLAKLPSTNYRIWVSVMLEVLYVVAILIMLAAGVDLAKQLPVIVSLGTFITCWLGLDVTQFRIKRKTHAPAAEAVTAPTAPGSGGPTS